MSEVNEYRAERIGGLLQTHYDLEHHSLKNALLTIMVDALHLAAQRDENLDLVRLAQEAERSRPDRELRVD